VGFQAQARRALPCARAFAAVGGLAGLRLGAIASLR
jgi:hypothetical protein